MKIKNGRNRSAQLAIAALFASGVIANAQISDVVKTNWVQRTHTNVVEVTMPKVVVVNEYRTNTTVRYATNVVEVQRTKWVDQFATNIVTSYATNRITRSLTNVIAVDVYRTNVTTINATNWQTVLVMKTNWVTYPVTNVVTLDLPVGQSQSTVKPAPSATATPAVKATAMAAAPGSTGDEVSSFVFEWGLASDDTKDVVVSLKSASDPAKTLPVQEWRVERTDAAILVMGNRAEFKGQLPAGDYNVAVKSRIDSKSPIVKLKGTIKVTSDAQVQTSSAMIVGQ